MTPFLGAVPLVVVTVGTDHHQFDRLVEWTDRWYAAQDHAAVDCFVQHGYSKAPTCARGSAFVEHGGLAGLLAQASVVVCHGGPATIMEARRAGHTPIVVPRDPRGGEHVDGHQQRFAAYAAREQLVQVVASAAELAVELERSLGQPRFVSGDLGDRPAPALAAIGALIEAAIDGRRPRRPKPFMPRRVAKGA